MSLKSKLKIESFGMFTALVFYAIAGVICFVVLGIVDLRFVHIGIIGMLNLVTVYGLLKKRVWTIWFVAILFFTATTFSVVTLYSFFGNNLILDVSMIAYLILTWIFTTYIATKRSALES